MKKRIKMTDDSLMKMRQLLGMASFTREDVEAVFGGDKIMAAWAIRKMSYTVGKLSDVNGVCYVPYKRSGGKGIRVIS